MLQHRRGHVVALQQQYRYCCPIATRVIVMLRKIDPEDLVDSTQVADLLGLTSANAVRVYRGRYSNFPTPVINRGKCVLWDRADIKRWTDSRERR